ncbi:beta-phosphoglucomutase [Listeria costaricensis]|uniref:beta-phosphoglucomutase n=1 Tax=Listeria costaricensis TaxID=2026604 RepID=UPI000C07B998|nr:beta-phosphoglucomutase [Listeria costaricensis]
MTLQAIIFDLDGVITDTAHFHYLAWKELADGLGVPFDEAFNEQLKGVSRMDSLELILKRGDLTLSLEDKERYAAQKNTRYVELLANLTPTDILPGVAELLAALRERGLRCALASVSKNAPTVLKALDLQDTFDVVVDAAILKNSKPDPEIFVRACSGLGISANEAIGIEDAQAGIESINRAGIISVGIGSGLKHADMTLAGTSLLSLGLLEQLYHTIVSRETI